MSWTNDIILEFLELYKGEQLLWDPKHPFHRNRSEINEAWERIQASLSIRVSVVDLKRKKESLMTSFRMHWHKKKKYQSHYKITWFAYSFMESFLGGKYECDSTNQIDNEVYPNPFVVKEDKLRASSKRIDDVKHRSGNKNTNSSEFLHSKPHVEDISCLKKATERQTATDPDEYDLYGQLLAKKLRKLDERQRDVAMHDIDNIMFRAKMQDSGSSKSRGYSSSPSPKTQTVMSPVFVVAQQDHHYVDDIGLQEN